MKKISLFIIILSAVVLVVLPGAVQGIVHPPPAVPGTEHSPPAVKIPNPEPRSGANFGFFTSGVDVDGDKVIVGAPETNSAYLFDCSTDPCVLLDTFSAPGRFGFTVAISDNYVLVGAPNAVFDGLRSGVAYLFDCEDAIDAGDGSVPCNDPIIIQKPSSIASLGHYVAISGSTLVISDTSDGFSRTGGHVYVYTCDDGTCELEQELPNPGSAGGHFGQSVAISENQIAVGHWVVGTAYYYDCTNFPCSSPVQLVRPSGASSSFGWDIGISEDTVVVGDSGRFVYVYDCHTTTCTFERTLISPVPFSIGYSVDIDGENVLSSNYGDDRGAHLFKSSTGELLQSFFYPGTDLFISYGTAVAISGTNLIIGAQTDVSDSSGIRGGSAYYYTEAIPDDLGDDEEDDDDDDGDDDDDEDDDDDD